MNTTIQVNQWTRVIRHQLKGVDRQLKTLRRQAKHPPTIGPGVLSGLMLLGISCIAGILLLGKSGTRNRETIRQLFLIHKDANGQPERETATNEQKHFIKTMGDV
jgi:hypothetical protein